MNDNKPIVTVYSAPWCAFCHAVKQYLDSKEVEYTEIDVDASQDAARELVERSHQAGIPVVFVGEEMIIGFDRPRIDSALTAAKLI